MAAPPLPVHIENYVRYAQAARDEFIAAARAELARGPAKTAPQLAASLAPRLDTVPTAPSEYVITGELPPILELYAPTLRALETRTAAALRAVVAVETRTLVTGRLLVDVAALQFDGVAVVKSRLGHALAPPPADVEAWGVAAARDKAQAFTIPLDAAAMRTQLDAALLGELARRAGVRGDGTVATWLRAQAADYDEHEREFQAAINDFTRVAALLTTQSMLEAELQVGYDATMSTIAGELQARWRAALAAAVSMADLQTRISPALVGALGHADDTAAAYVAAAPVFAPSDRVPAAPPVRDSSELFRTPNGSIVAALVPPARRILPASAITALGFIKTLPPAPAQLPVPQGARWHVLDGLQAWMERYGAADTRAAYIARKQLG